MDAFKLEIDPAASKKMQELLRSLISELDGRPLIDNNWENDAEFNSFWLDSQQEQLNSSLAVFENIFLNNAFSEGKIIINLNDLEALLKSTSYLRLSIQELKLRQIDELDLEKGDMDLITLDSSTHEFLWCYSMLAQIQEIALHLENQK